MSVSAIKSLFVRHRQVAVEKEARRLQKIEDMKRIIIIEEEEEDLSFKEEVKELDFLLKRNWFDDQEMVYELLWDANEDVFQEIVSRIQTYPYNIQQSIAAFIPMSTNLNLKLKIRELTDEDMELKEIMSIENHHKQMNDAWEKYKTENNIHAPVGDNDSEYDDIYSAIQVAKKELEDAKKKSVTGKYIVPHMREQTIASNPQVIEAEKKIKNLENELEQQKEVIKQKQNEWLINKRTEFEWKMLAL
jgi:hypothetical protein